MTQEDEKVLCETPTPGKQGTRIARWKYDLVRSAILQIVPLDPDGIPFRELAGRVARSLSEGELKRLGSVGWYTTTVKLDLEVRGELERIPASKPQRIRRVH